MSNMRDRTVIPLELIECLLLGDHVQNGKNARSVRGIGENGSVGKGRASSWRTPRRELDVFAVCADGLLHDQVPKE